MAADLVLIADLLVQALTADSEAVGLTVDLAVGALTADLAAGALIVVSDHADFKVDGFKPSKL